MFLIRGLKQKGSVTGGEYTTTLGNQNFWRRKTKEIKRLASRIHHLQPLPLLKNDGVG